LPDYLPHATGLATRLPRPTQTDWNPVAIGTTMGHTGGDGEPAG